MPLNILHRRVGCFNPLPGQQDGATSLPSVNHAMVARVSIYCLCTAHRQQVVYRLRGFTPGPGWSAYASHFCLEMWENSLVFQSKARLVSLWARLLMLLTHKQLALQSTVKPAYGPGYPALAPYAHCGFNPVPCRPGGATRELPVQVGREHRFQSGAWPARGATSCPN